MFNGFCPVLTSLAPVFWRVDVEQFRCSARRLERARPEFFGERLQGKFFGSQLLFHCGQRRAAEQSLSRKPLPFPRPVKNHGQQNQSATQQPVQPTGTVFQCRGLLLQVHLRGGLDCRCRGGH